MDISDDIKLLAAELSAREKAHELMNELAKDSESEEPAAAGKHKRTK